MHTETEIKDELYVDYPLEKIAPLDKILFLDIETTGFSAQSSYLYLIGCVYWENKKWHLIQWLASAYAEEKEILNAFFQFAAGFTHLIHFNGNNFDLPYMTQKCRQYGFSYRFDTFEGIDIYRRVAPFRELLGLANCKQKTVEKFLGLTRLDIYNGEDLISVYHDYVSSPSTEERYLLLLHNADDLKGMMQILPILAYYDLFNGKLKAQKVQANYYRSSTGKGQNMLYMKLLLPSALPTSLFFHQNHCYFKGEKEEGYLAVPLYEEEMKFFYANYKDYYYLPAEDCALHKSIAAYVDKEYRQQATAATCYSRKAGIYLPQWDVIAEPFFKREYDSKEMFFEVTDKLKKNRPFFGEYASHVLDNLRRQKALKQQPAHGIIKKEETNQI